MKKMSSGNSFVSYSLRDIFGRSYDSTDELQQLIDAELCKDSREDVHVIDLKGLLYVLNKPLYINAASELVITNGKIIAGPQFPINEYLVNAVKINTVKFENLLIECSKRANGIFFDKFIKARVEDCSILHQLNFGIYGNEQGGNHELEVVKCNIMEYVFRDGKNNKDIKGIIPDFRDGKNRTSVGVFLGQADNVVEGCNINLCNTGIRVGMRANRIHGNHITAGGTYNRDVFNCIEVSKANRSACLIVNNYIDNGRLYIETSDDEMADRNYLTVTDNLFYRGFNHPENEEFNHILVKPLTKNASFTNVIINSNQFYTQDADLDGEEIRHITPFRVLENEEFYLDHNRTFGSHMKNNAFTNSPQYKVKPMGTTVSKILTLKKCKKGTVDVSFEECLPFGHIQNAQVASEQTDTDYCINEIEKCGQIAVIHYSSTADCTITLRVDCDSSYQDYDYIVH